MGAMKTWLMELEEQAYDLGYKSVEDCCNHGYRIDWTPPENIRIVKEDK